VTERASSKFSSPSLAVGGGAESTAECVVVPRPPIEQGPGTPKERAKTATDAPPGDGTG